MAKYEAPAIGKDAFTCVHCGTLAQQTWNNMSIVKNGQLSSYYPSAKIELYLRISTCQICNGKVIWNNDKIIQPKSSTAPIAIEEMPENIKSIYDEARDIVSDSPRSACALLRLTIESLCNEIIPTGNLNTKIGKMVEQGLDVKIQRALDLVRLTGNNKIHPGQIADDDNLNTAISMFELVNYITDRLIIQPSKIDKMFEDLPAEKKEQIEKRDKQKETV